MAEYDDARRDDEYDQPRRVNTSAASRVRLPGLLLIILGMLGLLFELGCFATAFTNPNAVHEMYLKFIDGMQPGEQKDRLKKLIEDSKDNMQLNSPSSLISMGVGTVLSLLTLLGGFAMRSLGSYGLALTGSIASIIPISGCCCCAMPFGIWAVIVLMNADVKRAFRRQSRPTRIDEEA